MRVSTDYIDKFYEQNDLNISLEDCRILCSSPFKFLKQTIDRGVLKPMRIQYLGVFEINKPMVKYSKKTLEDKFSKGLVTEKRYKERMEILNNYES